MDRGVTGKMGHGRQLRLGIIGTGIAASLLHWPALREMPERFQVVAVANRSRDKAEAFARLVGLDLTNVYAGYRELLAREDLDVVLLALPTRLNHEVARAAAEAGIHVICEKPIAPTLEVGRDMLDLPREFGIKLMIAENFRYDSAVRKARELIDAGRVAAPFMVSYQYVQPVPLDDVIANTTWRHDGDYLRSGGSLIDHGVHMIDVLRYLMGDIAAVQVFASDLKPHISGLDTAVLNLKFASGAVGSIQWSFSVGSGKASTIQLWSEDGTLSIGADEVRLQRLGSEDEVFPCQPFRSLANEWVDFHDSLVSGREPVMTSLDAWKDLQAIMAASQSAASNQLVVVNTGDVS